MTQVKGQIASGNLVYGPLNFFFVCSRPSTGFNSDFLQDTNSKTINSKTNYVGVIGYKLRHSDLKRKALRRK